MTREWYPGYKGKTAKGEFIVIRLAPDGYLVEYISGPWVGKHIVMSKELDKPAHEIETLKLTKEQKEELLDVFFEEFPTEFESLYRYLYNTTGRQPSTQSIILILKEEYPPLFQIALNKYFKSK